MPERRDAPRRGSCPRRTAIAPGHESPMDVFRWDPDPAGRQITDGEVDVWLLRLDLEDPAGALLATLSLDERQNVARKRSALDGRHYAIGRAGLRAILARYLARPAAGLRLRYEPRGRPVLDPPTELSFSVAHAGAVGLVAVARARAVGVDVEPLSAASQIADIADRYLPPDRVAAIRAGQAEMRDEHWVGLWTEVEACAKLDGRGLAELDPPSAAALLDRDLHLVRFGPTHGHVGTLAYTGNAARVSYLAFEPVAFEPPSGGQCS
jgi:4'-phosphopantetheinyl transferase